MFELAARLVGVYKVNHMTKSVTIENQDYIARRVQQQQPTRPLPLSQPTLGFGNTTLLR